MPATLTVYLRNGDKFSINKTDYEGFYTRPADWNTIIQKFEQLAEPYTSQGLRNKIIETVQNFEQHTVRDLMTLLNAVQLANNVNIKTEEVYYA